MAKRRLTQQQQRRIHAARAQKHQIADQELGEARPGLVIARYGKRALIESDDGERRQCVMRANLDSLVAGDEVSWRPSEASGVIETRGERRSVLNRPDSRGTLRPVAANIDLLMVVFAPKPQAHGNLIDRYLVAAEQAGMEAILVLNKTDLIAADDGARELADSYHRLGYKVIETNRVTDPLADRLRECIANRTLALVGQSGVGKSSLINRLIPDLDIRIGALSDAIGKGRHTTTAAELYHLPSGGQLIDSPGIREFHLHHLPPEAVAQGFREFAPYLGCCRFRDCQHDQEQDCALLAALAEGQITEARFASYRAIVDAPKPI